MKTVNGHCESSKEISLSKAAKILSKFVSADNGASDSINKYLRRASAAFNELNNLHKDLNPSSHSLKKNKKHRIEPTRVEDDHKEGAVDNSVRRSVEELGNGHVKSNNDFGRQRFGSENYSDEVGEKQKKDKQKKHKNVDDENAKGQEQQQISNSVEGENGVQEFRMKKKHEAGSENRLNPQEVKVEVEQKKKRKFEDVEDRSGEDLTEKRMKRKHEG